MTKKYNAPYGVETRNYSCEIERRSDDETKTNEITGTPIVFNSRTNIGDMWEEEIDQHALDNADLKDVMLLVNHDRNGIPLARSRNNNANSTMQLTIEDDGLKIRANLDPSNPKSAELLSAVSRGDVNGMSFAFLVARDEWSGIEDDKPLRTIKEISKVIEVSAVNQPAYEATEISTRSLDNAKESLENERQRLQQKQAEAQLKTDILNKLKKRG